MSRRASIRWRVVAACALVALVAATSCTSTREYRGADRSTTTKPTTSLPTDDELEAEPSAQLQEVIDAALAADDICDVLSRSAFAGINIDSTALINGPGAVRQTYEGLVDVFDHLTLIAPQTLNAPLGAMRDTTLSILAVLDRYAARPNDSRAAAEIAALTQSEKYTNAQAALGSYAQSSCQLSS